MPVELSAGVACGGAREKRRKRWGRIGRARLLERARVGAVVGRRGACAAGRYFWTGSGE